MYIVVGELSALQFERARHGTPCHPSLGDAKGITSGTTNIPYMNRCEGNESKQMPASNIPPPPHLIQQRKKIKEFQVATFIHQRSLLILTTGSRPSICSTYRPSGCTNHDHGRFDFGYGLLLVEFLDQL